MSGPTPAKPPGDHIPPWRLCPDLLGNFAMACRVTPWSFKEDRRLMALAKSLKSLEEIARTTGRSPESIKKMAIRLGLSVKQKGATKNPPA